MIFKCVNGKELTSKGLTLLGDLDLNIDSNLIDAVKSDPSLVIILNNGRSTIHRLPRSSCLPASVIHLWIINDESYTDNLDDDTFTYFKYASSEASP